MGSLTCTPEIAKAIGEITRPQRKTIAVALNNELVFQQLTLKAHKRRLSPTGKLSLTTNQSLLEGKIEGQIELLQSLIYILLEN